MQRIKIKSGSIASGEPLKTGQVAEVPREVSAADAALLIRMGRAEWLSCSDEPAASTLSEKTPTKPRRSRRKNKEQ